MGEPIESKYFNWLCAKVLDNKTRNYYALIEILYKTEFVWVVPADKHRLADGLELRQDFLRKTRSKSSALLDQQPCSIFEMLIAFAKRASFQTDMPIKHWFWEFLTNLRLDQFTGDLSARDESLIEDILYTFTWRIYEPNGDGGMFPLADTHNDQREIELWYQLCEYMDEKGLF